MSQKDFEIDPHRLDEEWLVQAPRRKAYGERSQRIIRNSINYDTVAAYFSSLYKEIAVNKTPAKEIQPFGIDIE